MVMAFEHVASSLSPDAQGSLLESGYGAVPLELNGGSVEYAAYMNESVGAIADMAEERIEKAKQEGWVTSEEVALLLQGLLYVSCTDARAVGISRNRIHQLKDLALPNDLCLEKALCGKATPLELLSLIESYPEIGSIELARVSHMLDATGANEMTHAVESAITALGEKVESGDPYYKGKNVAPPLPAATVLRKQCISDYPTPAGRLQIIRRETFLVRGDSEARDIDPYIDRKISNPSRFDELTQKIEGYYPSLADMPHLRWLQPVATSFYARYTSTLKNKSAR